MPRPVGCLAESGSRAHYRQTSMTYAMMQGMNTSTVPRHRLYRIEGDTKQMNVALPMSTYRTLQLLAAERGWSMAEATRRGIALLLAQNMDIVNVLLSEDDLGNGASDAH